MKHLSVLIITVFVMINLHETANAQCTVSPHTTPGFYPSSQHGIHPAAATEEYSLNITIVVPTDTVVIPGFPAVAIDSATVSELIGFPAQFQYYYNTPSQWIKGGNSGCMRVYGTPTTADIGIHSISLVFSASISTFVLADTIFDFWQFEIKDASHVSVENISAGENSIELYPNPAGNYLNILTSESSEASVKIFNPEGRLVHSETRIFSAGTPELLSLGSLKSGIYVIRVEHPTGVYSRKISVVK